LSARQRGDLILRFLPRAQYVDIELRSTNALASVLQRVRRAGVGCILSFHHFGLTPSARSLHAKAKAAQALDALVFKVATRTDTADQLAPLLLFMAKKNPRLRVAAMGVGKLGAVSRLALAQCGSVFAYASIAQPRVEGQLSVEKLRSAFETLQIR
jgi:3-dehydroquinate dehydratase-1